MVAWVRVASLQCLWSFVEKKIRGFLDKKLCHLLNWVLIEHFQVGFSIQ